MANDRYKKPQKKKKKKKRDLLKYLGKGQAKKTGKAIKERQQKMREV
jgi:hypothetical protein